MTSDNNYNENNEKREITMYIVKRKTKKKGGHYYVIYEKIVLDGRAFTKMLGRYKTRESAKKGLQKIIKKYGHQTVKWT